MGEIKNLELERICRDPNSKLYLDYKEDQTTQTLSLVYNLMEKFKMDELVSQFNGYKIHVEKLK